MIHLLFGPSILLVIAPVVVVFFWGWAILDDFLHDIRKGRK